VIFLAGFSFFLEYR